MAATFVVEDGSGKTDANSYVSVADADQYNENHDADSDWSGATTAEKEAALRKGTQYIDLSYGQQWRGLKADQDQALDWPRSNVVDDANRAVGSDEIPQKLKDAVVEAAVLYNGGTDPLPNQSNPGVVKRKMQKADVVEQEIEYVGGNPPQAYYPTIDWLVSGIVEPGNKVYRA